MARGLTDCHTHVGETEHLSQEFLEDARRAWGSHVRWPVTLDQHLRAMSDVRRAVVLGFRAAASGFVVPNDYVASYVRQHPEKLVGFGGIDLAEDDPVEEVDRCAGELGLRGLKIGPTYQGVHPLDRRALAVFARAEALELPIVWHQGTTFVRSARLSLASPILVDEVAIRHPNLRVVIAHMGHPWVEDAVAVIRKHPNVYADVSALHTRPWQLYNALRIAVEYGAGPKLLFGSDFPFFTPDETAAGLRAVVRLGRAASLPPVEEDFIEELLERDGLAVLGVD